MTTARQFHITSIAFIVVLSVLYLVLISTASIRTISQIASLVTITNGSLPESFETQLNHTFTKYPASTIVLITTAINYIAAGQAGLSSIVITIVTSTILTIRYYACHRESNSPNRLDLIVIGFIIFGSVMSGVFILLSNCNLIVPLLSFSFLFNEVTFSASYAKIKSCSCCLLIPMMISMIVCVVSLIGFGFAVADFATYSLELQLVFFDVIPAFFINLLTLAWIIILLCCVVRSPALVAHTYQDIDDDQTNNKL